MSAVSWNLKIVATEEMDLLQQPIAIRHETAYGRLPVSRHLTLQRSELRCPHCDSVIYSRRHKLCGSCSRELPEELLFNSVEAERLENLLRTEQQRHRKWMRQKCHGSFAV